MNTSSAMRCLAVFSLIGCSAAGSRGTSPAPPPLRAAETAIGSLLDHLHAAAAAADEEWYFSHFATEAVFLGTDPAERWTLPAFRAYTRERFSLGSGWTYIPSARNITVAADGRSAFFDEVVTNEVYGRCRGTGALRLVDGKWKLVQYSLSLPLPNPMFRGIAERVKAYEADL